MWGDKKTEALPARPATVTTAGVATATAARPAPRVWEDEIMSPNPVETPRPAPVPGGALARVGPSLHIKGEISGNEDLELHGSVEGTVTLEERKLTVGASARVSADLVAREIVVYGSVKGNLRGRDRIEIKKDGSVVGDLSTARIMIEDGAYFKGSIEIIREGEADKTRSAHGG